MTGASTRPRGRFVAKPLQPSQVSDTDLVRHAPLSPNAPAPLVIEPNGSLLDVVQWVTAHHDWVMERLVDAGGVLFRGFDVASTARFASLARAITPNLLEYPERAAARTEVAAHVFTSTELAADQWIPLHHEMSYSHQWPRRIFFYCDVPPGSGGRTPVACERQFFPRLDAGIKRRFLDRGVMYVRNFGRGLDLTWQEAFQTDDRRAVEDYCTEWQIEWEWTGDDRLRTRQVRQAIAVHPETGETVWFNHAHLFHESNLEPDIRDVLLGELGSAGLPRNAYFGDGSPIDVSMLDEIRALYRECSVSFPWQRGDVLLLDNYLCAHGREPYTGSRRILVAMADLFVSGKMVA